MKKLALTLVAMAAVLFGTGPVVNAYPPGAGVVAVSPAGGVVAPGGNITVTGSCTPAETVTVTLGTATVTGTCSAAGTGPTGSAAALSSAPAAGGYSIVIAAPTAAGTYTLRVVGSVSGSLAADVTITVQATTPPVTQGGDTNGGTAAGGGTLPSTGSDSTSTALLIGFGSLLMGLGLFGTARVRRNQFTAVG